MKRAIGTVVQSTTSRHLPSLRFEGSADFRLAVLEAGFVPGDTVEIVRVESARRCPIDIERDAEEGVPVELIPLAERVEQLTAAADRLREQVQELETVKAENGRLQETLAHIERPGGVERCLAVEAENTRLRGERDSKHNAMTIAAERADGLVAENTRIRAAVTAYVASQEGYYDKTGKLHYCSHCDPLDPWNEADTEESGPTREQFTHWPDCKILALKVAAESDKNTIRQPTTAIPQSDWPRGCK